MNNDIWDQIILDTDPYRIEPDSLTAITDLRRAIDSFGISCEEAINAMVGLQDAIRTFCDDCTFWDIISTSYPPNLSYRHVMLGLALALITLILSV